MIKICSQQWNLILEHVVTLLFHSFAYIVWQKGYFHPSPLTVGTFVPSHLYYDVIESTLCLQSGSGHLFFLYLKSPIFSSRRNYLIFEFNVFKTGKRLKIKIIFWRYLNRYYLMILSQCYYKLSVQPPPLTMKVAKKNVFPPLTLFITP